MSSENYTDGLSPDHAVGAIQAVKHHIRDDRVRVDVLLQANPFIDLRGGTSLLSMAQHFDGGAKDKFNAASLVVARMVEIATPAAIAHYLDQQFVQDQASHGHSPYQEFLKVTKEKLISGTGDEKLSFKPDVITQATALLAEARQYAATPATDVA